MQSANKLWSSSRHKYYGICALSVQGYSCFAKHHSANICINTENAVRIFKKQISPKEALLKEFPWFHKLERRGGGKGRGNEKVNILCTMLFIFKSLNLYFRFRGKNML